MKYIFTRSQAVSVIVQSQNGEREVNIVAPVDGNHKLFKLSNEELEKKLGQHMASSQIAAVVDEPTEVAA